MALHLPVRGERRRDSGRGRARDGVRERGVLGRLVLAVAAKLAPAPDREWANEKFTDDLERELVRREIHRW